jgi:hypothetical protein
MFMNLRYSAENTSGGGCPKFAKRNSPAGRISPAHGRRQNYAPWRMEEAVRDTPLKGLSLPNPRVDVVTLLKIDVLKKVADHSSGGNRIPEHLEDVRNRTFHRHQPLAQEFIDAQNRVAVPHVQ